ncbi:hypothetical protein ACWCQZ_47845 [Streptomyces sp. NPDC002285]
MPRVRSRTGLERQRWAIRAALVVQGRGWSALWPLGTSGMDDPRELLTEDEVKDLLDDRDAGWDPDDDGYEWVR